MRSPKVICAVLVITVMGIGVVYLRRPLVRPTPSPTTQQAFKMGGMVEFKPGDPKSLIPPIAPVARMIKPSSKLLLKSSERLTCTVSVSIPPGSQMPCLVMFYLRDHAGVQYGNTLGAPASHEPDGTYLIVGSFPRTFPRGQFKLYAELQVIYLTGQGVQDDNAVIKPYYFDSAPVEIEVR